MPDFMRTNWAMRKAVDEWLVAHPSYTDDEPEVKAAPAAGPPAQAQPQPAPPAQAAQPQAAAADSAVPGAGNDNDSSQRRRPRDASLRARFSLGQGGQQDLERAQLRSLGVPDSPRSPASANPDDDDDDDVYVPEQER